MKGLTERIANLPPEKRKLLFERLRAKSGQGTEPDIVPQPRTGDAFELSFSQQRLWFSEQLQPGQSAYTIQLAFRLLGVLDPEIMEAVFRELIRRHEILRTTFPSEDGKPTQQIGSAQGWKLRVEDLSHVAPAKREAELQRLLDTEVRRPFDLEQGPLFRAMLIRLGRQDHALLLTTHHVISDATSSAIMAKEIGELYGAYATGRPPSLEELPVQYADYAVWQRAWLESGAVDQHLSYWNDQLAGAPPALDMPTDWPRPAVQTHRGAKLPLELSEGLSDALRQLGRQERCTPFMTLLTALKIVLYRQSGQRDLVVGAPVGGRTRPEVEGLIGCFINTLSLRTRLEGEPTFRQLLHQVRETVLGAIAHQELPFARLVEHLQPERDLSRTPIFQAVFNMLPANDARFDLPGLRTVPIDLPETESKFDFTLYAADLSGAIRCCLVYNADLFSRARMAELGAQYEYLLQQIVQDPDRGILRYALATSSSRRHLPDPALSQKPEADELVLARFARQAGQHPQRTAVMAAAQSVTFGQLDAWSNRVAAGLRSRGVAGQDVVAVYADRSAMLPCALLGILKAGAAFMILDPAYPSARQVDQLRAAGCVSLLRMASAGPLPEGLEDAAKGLRCGVIVLPERVDDAGGSDLAGCSAADPGVEIAPDDLAYVAFTSGTTGRPKAIAGTHRPLAHFLRWYYDRFDLGPSDRFSLLSGLSHDPLLRDVFAPLCLGATLCVPGEQDIVPGRLRRWLAESSVSVVHVSPAMEPLITAESPSDSSGLPSLRYVFFGGDQLRRAPLERLHGLAPQATYVNCYGATETPQVISYYVAAAGRQINTDRPRIPVGSGIADVQLLILNEAGQASGIGELGEVCVRTPYLARGYVNDPELTRHCFVENPFSQEGDGRVYRTGDLGRYLPDGAVELAGRKDRQVKIRGFRVEPGEVEAALLDHSAVREVVVTGRGDKSGNRQLVAYVVARDAADPPAVDDLRAFLQTILPDYMLPTAFVFLDARPLTPNGKVDYQALPAPDSARPKLGSAYAAPQTEIERATASVWREVLNIEQVGIHDNFFDLGGHSLLLVEIRSRLGETLQQDISVIDLFKYPTVSALSRFIAQRQSGRRPAAEARDTVERVGAGKNRLAKLRRQRQQKDE